MRKFLVLMMVLGLCLSSCKKDETGKVEPEVKESIVIKGKQYDVEFIRRALSVLLNAPLDQLVYDPEKQVFSLKGYAMEIIPADEIDDILKLKEAGRI